MTALIRELHARLPHSVLAITGGGASALAQLLSVPGSSRWLLEAVVPYAASSLNDFLGREPQRACSVETANTLASRALDRAHWLAPGLAGLGLGCTASLASDRPKKGEHRIHLSVHTDHQESRWSLVLAKGRRNRPEEEAVVAGLILFALARFAGVNASLDDLAALMPEDIVEEAHNDRRVTLPPPGGALRLAADGRVQALSLEDLPAWNSPGAILPGSFNPLHRGHWEMAHAAMEWLNQPVAFELSLANVDKPEMTPHEARRRLSQFAGRATVWVTRAARFMEKAKLFPGSTFVVGVDTALRIVDPHYYQGSVEAMTRSLASFREQRVRFLVACRVDGQGRCLTLDDVVIPEGFQDLFLSLPGERFRWDVSSTELRAR